LFVFSEPENHRQWRTLSVMAKGEKGHHNLLTKIRKKLVKESTSEANLGAPDRPKYGREIPQIKMGMTS
jgi:hypothetical protein